MQSINLCILFFIFSEDKMLGFFFLIFTLYIFFYRKDIEYVKTKNIYLKSINFSTKELFYPTKLKTEGGDWFLLAKLLFFRDCGDDKKWAGLLAIGPISFKTSVNVPGVMSIA